MIVLAFLGGVATLIAFLLLAAYLFAGLTRPALTISVPLTGPPAAPRLAACELFNRWEATHDTTLLNQAVADAHSPRVPWPDKSRFSAEMSGLRSAVRNVRYPHQSTTINNYEHAVQADCAPILATYRQLWRREHRPHHPRSRNRANPRVQARQAGGAGATASAR